MTKKSKEDDLRKAEFAVKLGKLMTEKSLNQSETARAAQQYLPKGKAFRRDSISTYLNKKALPRPTQLNALAKVFNVKPAELLPGVSHAVETQPYSMQPIPGAPNMSHLVINMKVSMRTAIAVLSLLDSAPVQQS